MANGTGRCDDGCGKSGIIGTKISATLASTGTPSFSCIRRRRITAILGMLVRGDIVLAVSNSGETEEGSACAEHQTHRVEIIAITGNPSSTLARGADHH